MKVILHLAVSADGFIASEDGNSDWVSSEDENLFISRAQDAGCLIVGRKTFEQYRGKIYPVAGVDTIILTSTPRENEPGIFSVDSAQAAINLVEKRGHTELLIAGGAKTSRTFLEKDLLSEIFFSVHPLVLGAGMRPFGDASLIKKLQLLSTEPLKEGLVQLHYRVI